jgi:hypothetical protein
MSSDAPDRPARVPIGLRATPRALARLVAREQALARYAGPALRRTPKRAGAPLRLAAAVLPPTAAAGVVLPPLPVGQVPGEGAAAAAADVLAGARERERVAPVVPVVPVVVVQAGSSALPSS